MTECIRSSRQDGSFSAPPHTPPRPPPPPACASSTARAASTSGAASPAAPAAPVQATVHRAARRRQATGEGEDEDQARALPRRADPLLLDDPPQSREGSRPGPEAGEALGERRQGQPRRRPAALAQQLRSFRQSWRIGIAKFRFSPPPATRTPTTWPCLSSAGPPELPGLAAASVWITFHETRLTTPVVTVP